MKLYTEEQLLNTIKSFQYYLEHYDKGVFPSVMEKHLKALTPIELPTDEEIEEYFKFGYGGDGGSAVYGAKWLLDKIKNK